MSVAGLKVRRAHSKRDISAGGSPRAGDVRGGLGSPDSSAEGHTMSLQTAPAVLSVSARLLHTRRCVHVQHVSTLLEFIACAVVKLLN